ncbi:DUF1289 domain-containing protein [Methylobacterium oryzae CBMB20]
MKKDAPCISVCEFHGRTGWCVGCGRTVPEIRAWRTMTPNRRTALARERCHAGSGRSPVTATEDGCAAGGQAARSVGT